MKTPILPLLVLVATQALAAEVRPVQSTRRFTDDRTGITVLSGNLELPAPGVFELLPGDPAGPLKDIFLVPPAAVLTALVGDRTARLSERRALQADRGQLHMIYWACRQYADTNGGKAPDRFEDLSKEQLRFVQSAESLTNYVLVPGLRFRTQPTAPGVDLPERQPLAFEVRPLLDDGKHYVLWNDGQVVREPNTAEHVARYNLEIVPRNPTHKQPAVGPDDLATYRLLARQVKTPGGAVKLQLRNRVTGQEIEASWDIASAAPGDKTLLADWARLRMVRWQQIAERYPSLTLSLWLRQAGELYGLSLPDAASGRPRTPGNQTTVFGVLGGRTAIRETLQMQEIGGAETVAPETSETVRLDAIKGVEIEAHPYEAMLKGAEGGRLALADLVPPDRFFVYFPKPEALVQFLDSGSDFLFHLSTGFTGRSIDYQLLGRYLARLGMTEDFMRSMLSSEALAEVALFLPDLHFIDGTDPTVVARVRNPALLGTLLKLVGMGDLDQITPRKLAGGQTVFWVRRGDLLLIGSQRSEVELALELQARNGAGSLGRSAEFRYLLTQLPPRETTRGYLYFSDPFLRRLTGPAGKIGQLRRVLARTQLEAASAGALLYRADHQQAPASAEALFASGYAPRLAGPKPEQIRLDAHLAASADDFGTPAQMKTLLEMPFDLVTEREARAYASYRDNYSQFWRQYFDPIAIRLDQTAPDRMEMETFILPLIDSSFYRSIREGVAGAEVDGPLRVPALEPEPVAMLSANLKDQTWIELLDDLDRVLTEAIGKQSAVLDQLGPGIHLALADNDPIIGTGSGDLLGTFGGGGARFGNDMFMLPLVVSFLTRPSSLIVELKDPVAVLRELESLPTDRLRRDSSFLGLENTLYRIAGENEWMYTLSVEGLLKLRFSFNVQDRFLVISNLPLSHRPRVTGVLTARYNGMRLGLRPQAVVQLAPSLYTAAMEQERRAAMEGIGMFTPLAESGVRAAEAAALHQTLFGFAPIHPPGGEFEWQDGQVVSSAFGRPGAERQAALVPGNRNFGVLRRVNALDLTMQFEQEGLRAVCGWSFQPKP